MRVYLAKKYFFTEEDFPLVTDMHDGLYRLRAAEHARAKVAPLIEENSALRSEVEKLRAALEVYAGDTEEFGCGCCSVNQGATARKALEGSK